MYLFTMDDVTQKKNHTILQNYMINLHVAFCKMFQLLISLDPLITGFLPFFYDFRIYTRSSQFQSLKLETIF